MYLKAKIVNDDMYEAYKNNTDQNLIIPHHNMIDLRGDIMTYYTPQGIFTFRTGLCINIPHGFVGLITPEYQLSKLGVTIPNSPGIIYPDYTDEIKVQLNFPNDGIRLGRYPIIAHLLLLWSPGIVLDICDDPKHANTHEFL